VFLPYYSFGIQLKAEYNVTFANHFYWILMRFFILCFLLFFLLTMLPAQQVKILFDATKAETANNADWVIDEDLNNLGWNPNGVTGGGSEGNAQQIPSPVQSGITAATAETYWKGAISAWGVDCVKKGYWVETLPYNGSITYGNTSNLQDLSNYKVFVVCEPNILFTTSEKTAMLNFVQNGGSLFMVSDHLNSDRNGDGKDSPQIWNDLMSTNSVKTNPFGITFDLLDISPNSYNIPSLPNDSLLHGPMGNVTQAQWFNGTSMTLNTTANASVKGVVYIPGSSFGSTGVMAAYARFGKGKVAAIGDSSPCDDGTGDSGDALYNGWTNDAAGNHERLIMNATIWLATKDSTIALPPPPTLVKDLKLDSILSPITFNKGNNTIAVRIKNTGTATFDSAVVSYQLNNNARVNASLVGMQLAPNNILNYTFTLPLNITADGTYSFCARIKTAKDTLPSNDSICNTFNIISAGLITTEENGADVRIYPNPIYGNTLHILNPTNEVLDLKITDMHGKTIAAYFKQKNILDISLTELQPGIYYLYCTSRQNSTIVRFIVQ